MKTEKELKEKIDVCPACNGALMWTPTNGIDTFYCPECDKNIVFYRRIDMEEIGRIA